MPQFSSKIIVHILCNNYIIYITVFCSRASSMTDFVVAFSWFSLLDLESSLCQDLLLSFLDSWFSWFFLDFLCSSGVHRFLRWVHCKVGWIYYFPNSCRFSSQHPPGCNHFLSQNKWAEVSTIESRRYWRVFCLVLAASLCHKDSWLPCTERFYHRRPARSKQNTPGWRSNSSEQSSTPRWTSLPRRHGSRQWEWRSHK